MIELTDQNFEEEIKKAQKPVVVDFWAVWCGPCTMLSPILEKLAEEYKDKFIFAKVNLDTSPLTAQKYGIEQIPTVLLFKNSEPIAGFIGLKTEEIIRGWLEQNWYQGYAQAHGFRLNPDRAVVEKIITGLLANEKKYGERYCPCRRVSGNPEEDKPKICPCLYHQEEIKKDGHCLCQLFFKKS